MKNSFRKICFIFRFVFRNIVKDYLNSLLVFFNFLIVFMFIMLTLSIEPIMTNYFLGHLEEKYNNIDMTMGVNYNSQTRYFSIRQLRDTNILDEIAYDYMPFFEIDTIIETQNKQMNYVKVMASELDHFAKVVNLNFNANEIVENHHIILTKSLADKLNVLVNDELTLNLGKANKLYQVFAIIDDDGLFQNDTVFVNKQGSIIFFLSTINPSLSQLNPVFFVNLYNKVYIDLFSDVSIADATDLIRTLTPYQNLDYQETINYQSVNQLISRATTVFYVIAAIILLALLLVLQTTFMIVFNQKKKVFSITQVIGGNNFFMLKTLSIEMFIFYMLALLFAIPLTSSVIRNGIQYVDSNIEFKLSIDEILISAIASFVIFFTVTVYYFYRFNKKDLTQHMKKEGNERKQNILLLTIIFIISISLYILLENNTFMAILSNNKVFFQVLFLIISMFSLVFVLSYFLVFIQRKFKDTSLTLSIKAFTNKQAFKFYISVTLVSILSIFLIFNTNHHIQTKSEILKIEQQVDFILLNTLNRYQVIYDEVMTLENVVDAQMILYYQNVDFTNETLTLDTLIAMDPEEIYKYFGYLIDPSLINKLSNEEQLVTILPNRFNELFGYQIGDMVQLNINQQMLTFELVGFFDKEIGSKAFTNLHLFKEQFSFVPNAILINGDIHKNELYNDLITTFSQYLVYVLDFQNELGEYILIMENANSYLIYINMLMILFFFISIIIHTMILFEQMKDTYAKFIMLGISRTQLFLLLIKENIYIFVVVFISAFFGFMLFYEQIPNLVIAFGEYEKIHFSSKSLMQSFLISFLFIMATKIIYIIKANQVDISITLKYHE